MKDNVVKTFIITSLVVLTLIASEWLFETTKPSFLDVLSYAEKLKTFFIAFLFFYIPVFLIALLGFGLDSLLSKIVKTGIIFFNYYHLALYSPASCYCF